MVAVAGAQLLVTTPWLLTSKAPGHALAQAVAYTPTAPPQHFQVTP